MESQTVSGSQRAMLCAMLLPLRAAVEQDHVQQRNILFILVDDLGKEWISCYGAQDIETPLPTTASCREQPVPRLTRDPNFKHH